MMVFDNWKNDCQVVYINTSQSKQNNMSKWMDAINRNMQEWKLDWKSNAFILDDVHVEINS
jgi:hypothetical protein